MNQHIFNRWLPCRNMSTETAPGFGVVRLTGTSQVDGNLVYTFAKPNDDKIQVFAILWPFDVISGGYGKCTTEPPFHILTDGSTMVLGESWSFVNATWTVTDDDGPFVALGSSNDTAIGVFSTVSASGRATMLWGQASEDAAGLSFDMDGIVPIDGFWPATSTTGNAVANPFTFTITNNYDVFAVVKPDGTLMCIQAKCPPT